DQTANADIPYIGGTLTFQAGQPQNGVFAASLGNLGQATFPLTPGTNTSGRQGTASPFGPFTGTSFLSPDNTFFYANITPSNFPNERVFVFGGIPVNPGFFQPTGQTRIFAFNVQPDAALQSNIPFIRSQAGGNLPNASVSPLYIVASPTTAIGDNSTISASRELQASLAINGQGASQQSAIAVHTGTFDPFQSSGKPILQGSLRGSSMLSANSPPVRIGSAVTSVVDGTGNSLYGTNAISGYVLDQTQYNTTVPLAGSATTPIIPSTASEVSLTGGVTNYGFAQPVLPTLLPSGIGASRTTQTISGNFGGLNVTSAQTQPYIVTGPI